MSSSMAAKENPELNDLFSLGNPSRNLAFSRKPGLIARG
jgi:hypothetical protein